MRQWSLSNTLIFYSDWTLANKCDIYLYQLNSTSLLIKRCSLMVVCTEWNMLERCSRLPLNDYDLLSLCLSAPDEKLLQTTITMMSIWSYSTDSIVSVLHWCHQKKVEWPKHFKEHFKELHKPWKILCSSEQLVEIKRKQFALNLYWIIIFLESHSPWFCSGEA